MCIAEDHWHDQDAQQHKGISDRWKDVSSNRNESIALFPWGHPAAMNMLTCAVRRPQGGLVVLNVLGLLASHSVSH